MPANKVSAAGHRPAPEGMDRLGFLLARHGTIANGRIREALSATGLSHRHGLTLTLLAQAGPMSQQGLVEALGVDPSVLVAILNGLERDGLAERRRDPADRRRHIVEMTTAGAGALTEVENAVAEVERDLFADLNATDIARLRDILSRIRTTTGDPACTEDCTED
jgi:DNA-binding MarR family transcriptional regulator